MRKSTRLFFGGLLTAAALSLCTASAAASGPENVLGQTTAQPVTPYVIDAPYEYLWTPSHKQANAWFCGPATCQIIDHYFGNYTAQEVYARHLGTTRDGTVFPRLDDTLSFYTAMSWGYHAGISTPTSFYTHVYHALEEKKRPMAIDIRIDPTAMDHYAYFHAGHILPLEAYDWRSGRFTVRVNDPYNEADYRSGGGQTYGHKTYPRAQMAGAVITSDRPDVIY
jgi:hypothetical protein